jgi:hypothetical protein
MVVQAISSKTITIANKTAVFPQLHESILFSLICGAVETHLWTVDLKQALLWSEMHYAGTLC